MIPSFELFEVLIAAAEAKNFAEAARRLGLSQGAVSLKLKRLQAQMPLPLFTLRGKKNVLTHYGREVYQFALLQAKEMRLNYERLNRKYARAENLSISIGCRRELFENLAPKMLFGGLVVHKPLSSREALNALLERRIDIAITYEKPNLTDVIAKKVLVSGAHLIVHRKLTRKWGKEFLRSRGFYTTTPCVLYHQDGHLLSQWIAHLSMNLGELKPNLVTEDWRTLQVCVDEGRGFAVVPDYIVPQSKEVEIHPLPQSVLPQYVFYAVFYRDLIEIVPFKQMIQRLAVA